MCIVIVQKKKSDIIALMNGTSFTETDGVLRIRELPAVTLLDT